MATVVAMLAFGGASAATTSARAEGGSPYCEKVGARASADASLLFAPTLRAQGVRYPRNGAIDSSTTVGQGDQLRTAIS